jgi:hypothetical protein
VQTLFIGYFANAAQEKKKEKKVLLPAGVSNSVAHTVVGGCNVRLI